jgi:hypothetical protein
VVVNWQLGIVQKRKPRSDAVFNSDALVSAPRIPTPQCLRAGQLEFQSSFLNKIEFPESLTSSGRRGYGQVMIDHNSKSNLFNVDGANNSVYHLR